MNTYIFIYKPSPAVYFAIHARRYYEAVSQLEAILGPERAWLHDYAILCNGVPMPVAA